MNSKKEPCFLEVSRLWVNQNIRKLQSMSERLGELEDVHGGSIPLECTDLHNFKWEDILEGHAAVLVLSREQLVSRGSDLVPTRVPHFIFISVFLVGKLLH